MLDLLLANSTDLFGSRLRKRYYRRRGLPNEIAGMSTSELCTWIFGNGVEKFIQEHFPEESAVLMHELGDDYRYNIEIVNVALSERAKIPFPLSRQECEDYLNRFKAAFFGTALNLVI